MSVCRQMLWWAITEEVTLHENRCLEFIKAQFITNLVQPLQFHETAACQASRVYYQLQSLSKTHKLTSQ